MNQQALEQIIEGSANAEPIARINGQNVYSFADAQNINKRTLAEEKIFGKVPELGQREMTEDGMGYKRTRVGAVAYNPDVLFMNRYKVIENENKERIYQVVLDYRSIKGQRSGSVSVEVPAYEVSMVKGKLNVRQIRVSAEDFINDFKGELKNRDVAIILETIEKDTGKNDSGKDELVF